MEDKEESQMKDYQLHTGKEVSQGMDNMTGGPDSLRL